MPRRTYVFAHDDGRVSKRTSDREYTHAVVGRRDLAGMRSAMERNHLFHAQTWKAFKHRVDVGPGGPWQPPSRGKVWTVSPHEYKEALDFIASYPTADDFHAAQVASVGEGDAGAEEVLQWSASERAAREALGRYLARYRAVRVVPVVSI